MRLSVWVGGDRYVYIEPYRYLYQYGLKSIDGAFAGRNGPHNKSSSLQA